MAFALSCDRLFRRIGLTPVAMHIPPKVLEKISFSSKVADAPFVISIPAALPLLKKYCSQNENGKSNFVNISFRKIQTDINFLLQQKTLSLSHQGLKLTYNIRLRRRIGLASVDINTPACAFLNSNEIKS